MTVLVRCKCAQALWWRHAGGVTVCAASTSELTRTAAGRGEQRGCNPAERQADNGARRAHSRTNLSCRPQTGFGCVRMPPCMSEIQVWFVSCLSKAMPPPFEGDYAARTKRTRCVVLSSEPRPVAVFPDLEKLAEDAHAQLAAVRLMLGKKWRERCGDAFEQVSEPLVVGVPVRTPTVPAVSAGPLGVDMPAAACSTRGPPWTPLHSAASIVEAFKPTFTAEQLKSTWAPDVVDPRLPQPECPGRHHDEDNATQCSSSSFRSSKTASQAGAGRLYKSYVKAALQRGEEPPKDLQEALARAAEHRERQATKALHLLPPPAVPGGSTLPAELRGLTPTQRYNVLVSAAAAGGEAKLDFAPVPAAAAGPVAGQQVAAASTPVPAVGVVIDKGMVPLAAAHVLSDADLERFVRQKGLHLSEPWASGDACHLCGKLATDEHLKSSGHLSRATTAAMLTWLAGPATRPRVLFTGFDGPISLQNMKEFWGEDVMSLHVRTKAIYQALSRKGAKVVLRYKQWWKHGLEIPAEAVCPIGTAFVPYNTSLGHYVKKGDENVMVFPVVPDFMLKPRPSPTGRVVDVAPLPATPVGFTWWPVTYFGVNPEFSQEIPTRTACGKCLMWSDCIMYQLHENHELWPVPISGDWANPFVLWGGGLPPPHPALPDAGTTPVPAVPAGLAAWGGVWDDDGESTAAASAAPAASASDAGTWAPLGAAGGSDDVEMPDEPAPSVPALPGSGWSGWGSSSGWSSSSWSGGGWGSSGW